MLVLGVGTGRCGTKSLTKLLGIQKGTYATHERFGPRVRWNCPSNLWPKRIWKDSKRNDHNVVADIDFKWTAHIGTYLSWAEEEGREIRIVGLKRNVDDTVDSYDKWKPNSDHWSFHGYRETLPDEWDKCYPCFETDSKREGIRKFWHLTYNIIEDFEETSDMVRCFPMQYLNTEEGVRSILNFIGYENPKVRTEIKTTMPSLQGVSGGDIWYQERDHKPFK